MNIRTAKKILKSTIYIYNIDYSKLKHYKLDTHIDCMIISKYFNFTENSKYNIKHIYTNKGNIINAFLYAYKKAKRYHVKVTHKDIYDIRKKYEKYIITELWHLN